MADTAINAVSAAGFEAGALLFRSLEYKQADYILANQEIVAVIFGCFHINFS